MSEPTARKRGRRGSPESWSVDAHVGQRVRMRRTLLGMSQEKLGEAIGLTFQQVQKYERGSNRISAGTLYRLGQVLDVPVSFFFDTYSDADGLRRSRGGFQESDDNDTQISRREARLLRLWRAAPSHVSDEMLSLLSALSPEIKEPPEGSDEGEDGEPDSSPSLAPTQSSGGSSSLAGSEIVAAAPEGDSVRKRGRTVRSDPQRIKPAKSAEGSSEGKARRRHGAVWDPTDILRATKPSPRS
ncbi:Transcriptional regulator, contains XRE-family HTH domain [Azospirillum oryzae]|uniref:Transcriptional regulator, contains XRE-family HTH domain n=1 Tax=Azospirillum oryzae TaxID=286727 RepID=A0A1X7GPD3_9PROT|nr:Transcriptional regulator, contains XRE-family HTH domain [Azospirillum oryzae]